jgi:hypothetical protein
MMDLKFFNICENLIPDVMHDVLEGALQYELKLLLQYIVLTKKFISVRYQMLILHSHYNNISHDSWQH